MTTQAMTMQTEKGSDYAKLSRQIKAAGLLEPRTIYYIWKFTSIGLLFAGVWWAFFHIGSSWWAYVHIGSIWWQIVVTAALLAIMATQVAMLGHDVGHRQVLSSKQASIRLNYVIGCALSGLSTGWWIDKHNRHHAHPNREGEDPDIADSPLVAFTANQTAKRGRVGQILSRFQAVYFLPLLLLEGLNLHVNGISAMLARNAEYERKRKLELSLLAVHIGVYFALLFAGLSPLQVIVFFVVHKAVFGLYMGLSFAPNHKGMLILKPDDKLDRLREQVLTSRNVRGFLFTNWLVSLALGGLNYQIEHHLFPSMPRPNLRHARRIVRQYCIDNGVEYTETNPFGSYFRVLLHLWRVGRRISRQSPA